ncbi:ATP-binding cassette domain-containing protein (plasmid) [Streptomyces sp. NBC_00271]
MAPQLETREATGTEGVVARGLIKRFGKFTALNGLDLTIAPGTVHGVLGPNGAGKTTLVRALSTLLRLDAGSAFVAGHDITSEAGKVRRAIGLTGQYASVDDHLSGFQNLYLIGRLLDMSRKRARARAYELLEWLDLMQSAHRVARTYSGGMRRRLDLAAGMVGRPQVLFLDEPSTGLDPRTRNELWDEIRDIAASGTAVLLTTQYMEEAEKLAQALTVMKHGSVVVVGTLDMLKAQLGGQSMVIQPVSYSELITLHRYLIASKVVEVRVDLDQCLLSVPVKGDEQMSAVIRVIASAGFSVHSIESRAPTLDEVFLTLTSEYGEPLGKVAGSNGHRPKEKGGLAS